MAYYNEITRRSDLVERTFETIADYFHTAAARHAKRRIYKTTLGELSALGNRDLADLGINRSEIKRLAWEAAEKAKVD
ncbi:DUF1127 domain-containing protein [Tateyamaria sp.]|uniref:DUF1127 domain-containing protein n=1 Tax=Tateyamaria sp. TaxID=1929288 RepID=UPI00329E8C51